MDGLKSLLNSEKALVVLALITAATVLTATGHLSVSEWKEYTLVLAGFYVAGKTLQGGISDMASAKVEAAEMAARGSVAAAAVATPPPSSTTTVEVSTSAAPP